MFDKSVIVERSTSARQRKQAQDLAERLNDRLVWWMAQIEDSPRELGVESQLQQLFALSAVTAQAFCETVEQAVVDSPLIQQLGKTAYNSLTAIGYRCESFEWTVL